MDNETRRDIPPMEDYDGDTGGGQASAFGDHTDLDATPLSNAPGVSSEAAADQTGEGSNLATDLDVRTGLVKGGTPGSDPLAGPGQYGGEAGSVSEDRGSRQ